MQKSSESASNAYFSQQSPTAPAKPKKLAYKLQICNQNLEEAIRQVRSNVQQNPEWRLNVKNVTEKYSNSINGFSPKKRLLLVQGKGAPLQISNKESNNKVDLQKLKYTDRLKQQYQERIRMVKEKRMQLQIRSIERQIQAKIERKISERSQLKEKKQLVQDLHERRIDSIRIRQQIEKKHQNQKQLLHDSSIAKVQMLRRHKKKNIKKELLQNKSLSESSSLDLKFKQFQINKVKGEQKEILKARYRSLRSASQVSVRTRIGSRQSVRPAQSGSFKVRPLQSS